MPKLVFSQVAHGPTTSKRYKVQLNRLQHARAKRRNLDKNNVKEVSFLRTDEVFRPEQIEEIDSTLPSSGSAENATTEKIDKEPLKLMLAKEKTRKVQAICLSNPERDGKGIKIEGLQISDEKQR